MSNPQFYIYRAWGEKGDVLNISHNPELDLDFYAQNYGFNRLEILNSQMPVAKALGILKGFANNKQGQISSNEGTSPPFTLRPNKSLYAFKPGACLTAENRTSGKEENVLPGRFPGPSDHEVIRIHQFVAGRIALWEEIRARVDHRCQLAVKDSAAPVPGPVSGLSYQRWPLLDILQVLYLTGSARLLPGIGFTAAGELICNRCGQDKSIIRVGCPDCGEECYQCEECLPMGTSRTCTPLWAFPGGCKLLGKEPSVAKYAPTEDISKITIAGPGKLIRAQLDFPLTQAQRDAARQVLETVASEEGSRVLVWAACGAGKTEVSFGAIAYTLRRGGKVLFAIPRRDVVRELEPRLRKAFPDVKIISLYGGSEDKYSEGDLVLATTHQVIRYYRNFDLVVLDEADAFPYRDSAMLHFAVERARKPGGKLVLMTATPEDKLLGEAFSVRAKEVCSARTKENFREMPEPVSSARAKDAYFNRDGIVLVTIPARHHGFPLPEPEIVVDKKIQVPRTGSIFLPKRVLDLVCTSVVADRCQLFLFVPQVALARRVAEYLREALAELGIHYVHAEDPQRDRKIQAFKDGKFPVLVSTSIMERGITVSRCNVLVLMANRDQIFDAGTLVQMAGRAGRTGDYPEGKVWFVGDGISPAMKAAVQRIREMNTEARRRGYLIPRNN